MSEFIECEWRCADAMAMGSVNHVHPDCTVHNPTRLEELDHSFLQDSQRWVEGYVDRRTEAVRGKVTAASNGVRH